MSKILPRYADIVDGAIARRNHYAKLDQFAVDYLLVDILISEIQRLRALTGVRVCWECNHPVTDHKIVRLADYCGGNNAPLPQSCHHCNCTNIQGTAA